MKVTLRKRTKNGKTSLYLDYYSKGIREYEYLSLYLIEKPKSTKDRISNKKTLELAENIRAKRQLEVQNKIYGFDDNTKQDVNFISYFNVLTENRLDSLGNHGNWKSTLNHLKSFAPKGIKFSEIDKDRLEDFKSHLNKVKTKNGKYLSQNSKVSYFNKIIAALKQAVKDGYIKNNPANQVSGFKEAETKREFLTLEELRTAIKKPCQAPVFKNAFIFSCLTGLRFSDIKKLTWAEIQYSVEYGHYIRFQQKKTKGQETLPISVDAREILGTRLSPDEKVFIDIKYSDHDNKKLRDWIKSAGINKHISFHCARHTYATLQLSLGTDIYTVSKLLGHKNLKTTEIYTKVIDQNKVKAANRIKL